MDKTPHSMRVGIGIFGRTNVGKSTIFNLLLDSPIAITSPLSGTTTDTVKKAIEFEDLGAVSLIDTAGFGDTSMLSERREEKSLNTFDEINYALIIIKDGIWGDIEEKIAKICNEKKVKFLVISNTFNPNIKPQKYIQINGLSDKEKLLKIINSNFNLSKEQKLLDGLICKNDVVLLVTPIDKEAPKGRLIAPQVQAIRAILDENAILIAAQTDQIPRTINLLKDLPNLVICDSQCLSECIELLPKNIKITTFSMIFARFKGGFDELLSGAKKIQSLTSKDKVLIAEACLHHNSDDDIARVKIPKMLTQFLGFAPEIHFSNGSKFNSNLDEFALIIHCGGCMLNQKAMQSRVQKAKDKGVSITNYGMAISVCKNELERTIRPFLSSF